MTQAFNLAQLANNINSSGQLDATDGLSGLVPIANGGTGQSTANASLNALLPSQSGNSGKVLSTNGSSASWATQSIVKMAYGIKTTVGTYNSGAPTATGLTASITPVSASNKIMINASFGDCRNFVGGWIQISLYRNGSFVCHFAKEVLRGISSEGTVNIAGVYIDSPATTSACNYEIYASASNVDAGYIQFPLNGTFAQIVLSEITA